ncbi:MAG: hypothetical protein ACRC1H_02865 [Caldilineaceae bacterium]
MSKTVRILLVMALLVGAVAMMQPQVALAQGPGDVKFDAYISGIQVANLDPSSAASVALTAFNADGSQNGSPLSDSIPVNSSKTYFPIGNVSPGFSGSIVISSNKNVAAISNILGDGGAAGASYVGRSGGSNTVLLPLLNKNNSGYTTWFSVQNAGGSDANITINYSSNVADVAATIKPGAAKVFYQNSEAHNIPTFAATITSSQPIVAAVIQESEGIMFAYTGFAAGVPAPVFPLINANNSGYITGVQIQNAGNTATDVTLSYTPSPGANNGTACTETQTIQPGASNTFALLAFNRNAGTENCANLARFVGSARVTANSANQPLVGVGNQLGTANGGAYVSFSDADAGQSVSMPLIMDRNGGYFTGFNVQNIGAAATNVNCTFSNSAVTVSANLAPGAALNDIQGNKLAAGYVGAATCTGDAGAKLVAVVNQVKPSSQDNFLVYEGVKR